MLFRMALMLAYVPDPSNSFCLPSIVSDKTSAAFWQEFLNDTPVGSVERFGRILFALKQWVFNYVHIHKQRKTISIHSIFSFFFHFCGIEKICIVCATYNESKSSRSLGSSLQAPFVPAKNSLRMVSSFNSVKIS